MCVEGAGGGGAVAELERAEAHLLGGVAVAVGLALAVEHLVFGRAAPAYHSGLCKEIGTRNRVSCNSESVRGADSMGFSISTIMISSYETTNAGSLFVNPAKRTGRESIIFLPSSVLP